ncbi:hypothetical protein, partial [Providencia rettgeri]
MKIKGINMEIDFNLNSYDFKKIDSLIFSAENRLNKIKKLKSSLVMKIQDEYGYEYLSEKTNINSEVTAKIDEVNKAIRFFEGNLLAMKNLASKYNKENIGNEILYFEASKFSKYKIELEINKQNKNIGGDHKLLESIFVIKKIPHETKEGMLNNEKSTLVKINNEITHLNTSFNKVKTGIVSISINYHNAKLKSLKNRASKLLEDERKIDLQLDNIEIETIKNKKEIDDEIEKFVSSINDLKSRSVQLLNKGRAWGSSSVVTDKYSQKQIDDSMRMLEEKVHKNVKVFDEQLNVFKGLSELNEHKTNSEIEEIRSLRRNISLYRVESPSIAKDKHVLNELSRISELQESNLLKVLDELNQYIDKLNIEMEKQGELEVNSGPFKNHLSLNIKRYNEEMHSIKETIKDVELHWSIRSQKMIENQDGNTLVQPVIQSELISERITAFQSAEEGNSEVNKNLGQVSLLNPVARCSCGGIGRTAFC